MDCKATPRPRVGIGQGFFTEAVTPKRVVRIRAGEQVSRGSFVGEESQAIAFVWTEEEVAVPSVELVVQASREAWLWQDGKPVQLKARFPHDKAIARLEEQFDDWQRFFVKYYSERTPNRFYWGRFHEEGRGLARRLQAELIDRAVVRYLRPTEDPQSRFAPEFSL